MWDLFKCYQWRSIFAKYVNIKQKKVDSRQCAITTVYSCLHAVSCCCYQISDIVRETAPPPPCDCTFRWKALEAIGKLCSDAHLIFVNLWRKSVMWGNFRFEYMTDVVKSEFCPHLSSGGCLYICTIYTVLLQILAFCFNIHIFLLQFSMFCWNLRIFVAKLVLSHCRI